MINSKKNKDKKKDLQIIGQGGYGCVFRPEIRCSTLRPGDKSYVSKVQLANIVSNKEIKIGKIIQTIPNYSFYFAPILENCPLSIKTIQTYKMDQLCDEIKEEIQNPTTTSQSPFVSNKIQYIGGTDLGDYINDLLLKCKDKMKSKTSCNQMNTWHKYMKKHIYSNLYILRGIQKLSEKGIVHLDIKSNNIMYQKKDDVFVYIDFGFSCLVSELEASTYESQAKKPFGILTTNYIPWCIDILLLSYIARQIKLDTPTSTTYVDSKKFNAKPSAISMEEMESICTKYTESLQLLFTKEEQKELNTQLQKWLQGFAGKNYKDIWTKLVANWKSWDNYSICAMYIYEWVILGIFQELEKNKQPGNIMNTYIDILKSVLLAIPEKRNDSVKTYASIVKLFSKIKKSQYEKMVDHFSKIVSSPEHVEKIKDAHQEQKIVDQQIEEQMKKRAP